MINVYKRKNEIWFNDSIWRRKLNKHIETHYIKLDKGYYSIKELFIFCFNNIFWVNILSLFSKDKNNG